MRISSCFAFMGLGLVLLCSCATTAMNSPYRDPTEFRGNGRQFTSYDIQQCAIAMVDSMLSNSNLARKVQEQFPSSIPVVAIDPIHNGTLAIFDLDSLVQKIEHRLVNSGRFDLVDKRGDEPLISDKLYDANSALTGDAGVTDFGNLARSDYLLTGELVEKRETYGNTRESYYILTMRLRNKRTRKIDWSGEKEIRKVSSRKAIGW